MKACNICKIAKEDADFTVVKYTTRSGTRGVSLCSYCKQCNRKRASEIYREKRKDPNFLKRKAELDKKWRKNNPEKRKQVQEKYVKSGKSKLCSKRYTEKAVKNISTTYLDSLMRNTGVYVGTEDPNREMALLLYKANVLVHRIIRKTKNI